MREIISLLILGRKSMLMFTTFLKLKKSSFIQCSNDVENSVFYTYRCTRYKHKSFGIIKQRSKRFEMWYI